MRSDPWGAALALLLLAFLSTGCIPESGGGPAVELVRQDGVHVVCQRPTDPELDATVATQVAADVPRTVQVLLGGGSPRAKADTIASVAQTVLALKVLDYRICLEYGQDVIDGPHYQEWRRDIEPRLRARVRPTGPDTGSS